MGASHRYETPRYPKSKYQDISAKIQGPETLCQGLPTIAVLNRGNLYALTITQAHMLLVTSGYIAPYVVDMIPYAISPSVHSDAAPSHLKRLDFLGFTSKLWRHQHTRQCFPKRRFIFYPSLGGFFQPGDMGQLSEDLCADLR